VANEVKLPRLGQGMEAGTITRWLKSEGDTVTKGEPLFEIDTDKVTQEVEADYGGVLLKIELASGEAPVGQTIAWIGDAGEKIQAAAKPAAPEPEKVSDTAAKDEPAPEPERVSDTSASASNGGQTGGRIKASPLARRIARERGIELSSLRGTGPDGRIVAEDVERGAAPEQVMSQHKVPTGEIESVPLTSIRKTIARRLTAAWQAPVFQLTVSADMTRANELVERSRELNPDVRVTVTDLLVKLSAQSLRRRDWSCR
jgi:pyruvate dehydrogenase E2 component (dihydrolipoamide acetyltransferase)